MVSIRAVTFDLWETLLFEKDGWNARRINARCSGLTNTLRKHGFEIPAERFQMAFNELSSWLADKWTANKEVSHEDQIRFVTEAASEGLVDLTDTLVGELSEACVSAFFEVRPYLNPDALMILQQLKERKKGIGLICNTGLTPGFGLRRFLEVESVATFLDSILFSDEVGIRKPHPLIFKLAAEELRVKPENIVHVGDNLRSDVYGGKKAGFKTIYFCSEAGRDKAAEADPESLVSISRRRQSSTEIAVPDKTISSLALMITAIDELDE